MSSEQSWKEALARRRSVETEALQAGGEARPAKQEVGRKLSARARIVTLLDAGSFTELNMLAEHQCRDFGMEKRKVPGDGVVTGHGSIGGRRVFIYAEDENVLGGSTGRTHGAKIQHVLRLARDTRVPVICLNASAGARIQEGMDNVYGITGMFHQNVLNSGVVPQIAAVMGTCSGGAAYSSALCDFLIQVENAPLFITGPAVAREITGEEVSTEDLGGAGLHGQFSGVAHLTARDDRECLDLVRRLLDFLPQNNRETPSRRDCRDAADRQTAELLEIVPIEGSKTYDMKEVVRVLVDEGDFFEIHPAFARNLVVGFARMGGAVMGIVANNPRHLDGFLDVDSSNKGARFIRICDAFNIPLLSLVDSPGFLPGLQQERGGIIRHGAKLLYAWSEAAVPKIAVVLRKMHGGAIPAMGVHEIGFDQVFAWPSAEMQIIAAGSAVKILYRRELENAGNPAALFDEKVREYQEGCASPYHAASRSVVDAVIEPGDTRRVIVSALRMLEGKRATPRAGRRHGNIPL
ncbi:MAG: methylmalonyl-CoA carboxyltransferase [Gammaproteobacteria bacterium]|nr:methylmalonyl-CoA carboxyltransferase [Gammaproteobacteria bacterium]